MKAPLWVWGEKVLMIHIPVGSSLYLVLSPCPVISTPPRWSLILRSLQQQLVISSYNSEGRNPLLTHRKWDLNRRMLYFPPVGTPSIACCFNALEVQPVPEKGKTPWGCGPSSFYLPTLYQCPLRRSALASSVQPIICCLSRGGCLHTCLPWS